ncbi:MAG: metallophosphoesterase, partial [Betaproteobacteria bacterium]|nr:metallophosphoesterase [Betaproteobacteria bacterium]
MSRFALVVTAMLGVTYAYVASRLAHGMVAALALAVPFILIWIMPIIYWGTGRSREGFIDQLVHRASYLSMAWVSFILVFTIFRDLALMATSWTPAAHDLVRTAGIPVVLGGSLVAIACGAVAAFRGPRIERVDIPVPGLHPDLDGFRIVQISDLHVGPNIGRRYVQRVAEMSRSLNPDLVVLTGDIVDGPVPRLTPDVEPLT